MLREDVFREDVADASVDLVYLDPPFNSKRLYNAFIWSKKAERQQDSVPMLPLFVHERHSTQAILETLQSHKARGATLDLFGIFSSTVPARAR